MRKLATCIVVMVAVAGVSQNGPPKVVVAPSTTPAPGPRWDKGVVEGRMYKNASVGLELTPAPALEFGLPELKENPGAVYAASRGNPSVVDAIDAKTNAVVTEIALPGNDAPTQIRVSPDGGHAYVTGEGGHVWVIDTSKNTTVATLAISDGNPLLDIAFLPDGTRAYISCGNTSTIYVLDTTTYDVVASVRSSYPGGLAIAPTS